MFWKIVLEILFFPTRGENIIYSNKKKKNNPKT